MEQKTKEELKAIEKRAKLIFKYITGSDMIFLGYNKGKFCGIGAYKGSYLEMLKKEADESYSFGTLMLTSKDTIMYHFEEGMFEIQDVHYLHKMLIYEINHSCESIKLYSIREQEKREERVMELSQQIKDTSGDFFFKEMYN